MSGQVNSGWAKGQVIRTARKPGRCDYWMGEAGRCRHIIQKGERYVEGERNDFKAGGWGCDRWCSEHFTPEEIAGH